MAVTFTAWGARDAATRRGMSVRSAVTIVVRAPAAANSSAACATVASTVEPPATRTQLDTAIGPGRGQLRILTRSRPRLLLGRPTAVEQGLGPPAQPWGRPPEHCWGGDGCGRPPLPGSPASADASCDEGPSPLGRPRCRDGPDHHRVVPEPAWWSRLAAQIRTSSASASGRLVTTSRAACRISSDELPTDGDPAQPARRRSRQGRVGSSDARRSGRRGGALCQSFEIAAQPGVLCLVGRADQPTPPRCGHGPAQGLRLADRRHGRRAVRLVERSNQVVGATHEHSSPSSVVQPILHVVSRLGVCGGSGRMPTSTTHNPMGCAGQARGRPRAR